MTPTPEQIEKMADEWIDKNICYGGLEYPRFSKTPLEHIETFKAGYRAAHNDAQGEIEKLKQENKKYREEMDKINNGIPSEWAYAILEKERDELKAENAELKDILVVIDGAGPELSCPFIDGVIKKYPETANTMERIRTINTQLRYNLHAKQEIFESQLTAERAASAELSEMFCDLYTEKFENRIDWPGDSFHDFLGKYEALFEKTVAAHNARQKERG